MKIFNFNIKPFTLLIAAALVGVGVTSCSEWNDHYEGTGVEGSNTTLWDQIQERPELSDFAEVLTKTKVFRMHKKTEMSYADILKGGQSLTVLAPVNGTFNKDSILNLVQTNVGDSAVERFFVMNHITRSPKSAVDSRLRLLNNKKLDLTPTTANGVGMKESNVHCKNGVLHVVESELPYTYTIYEALTHDNDLLSIGDEFIHYNKDEFDEKSSISSGLVDGIPVYVDSVVYETNILMNAVGQLNAEDSAYHVVVPTNEGWRKAWDEASSYFVYSSNIEGADSLQKYWTNRALLDDAVFSETIQRNMEDSIISYHYNRSTPEYHVFKSPLAEGGILKGRKSEEKCSNGVLYKYDEWPFDPVMTYFKKIESEGEYSWNILKDSLCNYSTHLVDSTTMKTYKVSKNGFIYLQPTSGTANWTVKYKMPNVLSGKYDICVVALPITIADPNVDKIKPCHFKAEIGYVDADGANKVLTTTSFSTDQTKVDSVIVAQDFQFPTTNYERKNDNFYVKLICDVGSRQNSTYERRFLLDCILLLPKRN